MRLWIFAFLAALAVIAYGAWAFITLAELYAGAGFVTMIVGFVGAVLAGSAYQNELNEQRQERAEIREHEIKQLNLPIQ